MIITIFKITFHKFRSPFLRLWDLVPIIIFRLVWTLELGRSVQRGADIRSPLSIQVGKELEESYDSTTSVTSSKSGAGDALSFAIERHFRREETRSPNVQVVCQSLNKEPEITVIGLLKAC